MPTLEKDIAHRRNMYRSGNPALNDSTFQKSAYKDSPWWEDYTSNMMTIEGVSEKTGLLLLITATTALATAFSMPEAAPLIFIGFLGSFIVALIVIFCLNSPFPKIFN